MLVSSCLESSKTDPRRQIPSARIGLINDFVTPIDRPGFVSGDLHRDTPGHTSLIEAPDGGSVFTLWYIRSTHLLQTARYLCHHGPTSRHTVGITPGAYAVSWWRDASRRTGSHYAIRHIPGQMPGLGFNCLRRNVLTPCTNSNGANTVRPTSHLSHATPLTMTV